jgi:DNA-binding transcriptional ArsR family regulator
MSSSNDAENTLSEQGPVTVPDLPTTLLVNTYQQCKAIGDQTRWQILDYIQHRPATAKQIADVMHMSPGTIGHHLRVLESAGLARIVARRTVHGIVAKYYTRTARTFIFDFPPELEKDAAISAGILTKARNQLVEAIAEGERDVYASFPQVRLSPAQAQVFQERLRALVNDFIHAPYEPDGQIYGMCTALFSKYHRHIIRNSTREYMREVRRISHNQ